MNRLLLFVFVPLLFLACKQTKMEADPDLVTDLIGTYSITSSYQVPPNPGADPNLYSTKEDKAVVTRHGNSLDQVDITLSLKPFEYGQRHMETTPVWLRVQNGKIGFYKTNILVSNGTRLLGIWNNDNQLNLDGYHFIDGSQLEIGFKAVKL